MIFFIQIRNLSVFLLETTYHSLIQSPDQQDSLTTKPNIIGRFNLYIKLYLIFLVFRFL